MRYSALFAPGRIMSLVRKDEDLNDEIVVDVMGPNIGAQGVYLLTGFTGFMHAPRTPVRESAAYQEGSKPSPHPRVDERIMDIRLAIQGETAEAFEEIVSLIWSVLRFKQDAYVRWYSGPGGREYREMKVRLDRKPTDTFQLDPRIPHMYATDVTLVGYEAFWFGDLLYSTWKNTNGTGIGEVLLSNPGDTDLWLEWSGDKPAADETWTLPDAGGVYPVGHSLAGQLVKHTLPPITTAMNGFLVQTHPLRETLMVLNDEQAWAKMRAEDFLFAIPPDTEPFPMPVALTGGTTSSSITAWMLPRWELPFGSTA